MLISGWIFNFQWCVNLFQHKCTHINEISKKIYFENVWDGFLGSNVKTTHIELVYWNFQFTTELFFFNYRGNLSLII